MLQSMTTEGKTGAGGGAGLTDTQQMMFAFGDARRPNLETAKLGKTNSANNRLSNIVRPLLLQWRRWC